MVLTDSTLFWWVWLCVYTGMFTVSHSSVRPTASLWWPVKVQNPPQGYCEFSVFLVPLSAHLASMPMHFSVHSANPGVVKNVLPGVCRLYIAQGHSVKRTKRSWQLRPVNANSASSHKEPLPGCSVQHEPAVLLWASCSSSTELFYSKLLWYRLHWAPGRHSRGTGSLILHHPRPHFHVLPPAPFLPPFLFFPFLSPYLLYFHPISCFLSLFFFSSSVCLIFSGATWSLHSFILPTPEGNFTRRLLIKTFWQTDLPPLP